MAQKQGLTIAFLGTGRMDINNATDLIEELIDAVVPSEDDPVKFVFPLTTAEFSETLEDLVKMAKKSEIAYEVVTHTEDKGRRAFIDIAEGASKKYHVADVYTQIEQILTEAPTSVLEVLWDDKREEELTEILNGFLDAGVDVRDLTDGNVPMAEDEGEDVATTEQIETGEAIPVADEETGEIIEEAQQIFTRTDLEKMGRAEVREITLKLGLPPRKATAAMVEAILEAQGGYPQDEAPVETQPEMTVEVMTSEIDLTTGTLTQAISEFPGQLHAVLDQFLTDLSKTIEGLIFNLIPEEPMPVEEPKMTGPPTSAGTTTARRLRR
jgi:hypothetical protein